LICEFIEFCCWHMIDLISSPFECRCAPFGDRSKATGESILTYRTKDVRFRIGQRVCLGFGMIPDTVRTSIFDDRWSSRLRISYAAAPLVHFFPAVFAHNYDSPAHNRIVNAKLISGATSHRSQVQAVAALRNSAHPPFHKCLIIRSLAHGPFVLGARYLAPNSIHPIPLAPKSPLPLPPCGKTGRQITQSLKTKNLHCAKSKKKAERQSKNSPEQPFFDPNQPILSQKQQLLPQKIGAFSPRSLPPPHPPPYTRHPTPYTLDPSRDSGEAPTAPRTMLTTLS